jgi:putative addiction module antidote
MNKPLKIVKIGNSAGVILPKEILARLRVGLGDNLFLTERPEGFTVTASSPDFEKRMELAEQIMREDRDILHVLAQ